MKKALKLFTQDDLTRYKILKHISARSRCDFFKVVDKETDNLYAFKILRPVNDNDQGNDLYSNNIKKFMEEAEIWSIVNSPLILKMIGLCFNYKIQNNTTAIMVLEYCLNDSLEKLIKRIKSGQNIREWNDTRKLICIYGIAAGMQCLHSKQIIHLDLRPANILLDEFLFPKINDFFTSIRIGTNNEPSLQKNAETIDYMAPELVNDDYYSTASDVYSFGVTVHEILTYKKPYEGSKTDRTVKISDQIPKSYQNLISKCLVADPRFRPAFSDIVKYLRCNKKFITESLNEEEFLKFCESVDSAHQVKTNFEKKVEIDLKPISLSLFKKEELIKKEPYANIYRVVEIKTGNKFLAKVNIADNVQDNQSSSREINILLKLNSNSILKFIGYSENDFCNKPKMTIITEFAKSGSLDQILDNERKRVQIPKWNDTKRLINILGIAFGMSYLHSKNILHRDLKPENIFLDELFYPKIGGFRFSKEIEYISEEDNVAGTIAYMSPEQIMTAINHKASDVYSFALIVYEIMTHKVPYKGFDRNDILLKVTAGYRPEIAENIPDCYRELIQKCWSQDPSERPTFSTIVDLLKNNPEFITNKVNRSEFNRYVNSLDKCSSDIEELNEKEIISEFLKIEEEEEEAEIEADEIVHESIQLNNSDKSIEKLKNDLLISEINQQNQEEQKIIPENEEEKNNISICEEESDNEEDQKYEEPIQKVIPENEEEQKEIFLMEEKEFENNENLIENYENDEIIMKDDCSEEADESEQRSESEESSKPGVDHRNGEERIESSQEQKSKKLNNKKYKIIRRRRAHRIQNKQDEKIKVEPEQPVIPNNKEPIKKEAAKPIQTNENAQVSKEPPNSPKNVKISPPPKPFVSHYDRSVFYQQNNSPLIQAKQASKNSPEPIKLKVTLKDIGLEGLDSPDPYKALEFQRKRKIEQENSKLNAKNQQNSQAPLSQSRRTHFASMEESNKKNPNANNAYYNPKPVSLLSSAHKARRSQKIIPKTNSRRNKY